MKTDRAAKYFHFRDLIIKIHPEVYDPAEDTFLLIEAITVTKGDYVLEIGTGCGLIALECARLGANVVCTDINPYAVDLSKYNFLMNKHLINGSFEVRDGDLFSVVKQKEVFDVVIFNPPYLPTLKRDLVGGYGWFDIATNGGVDGLKITTRFIDELPNFLKKEGHALFVFSSLSDLNKLESHIKKRGFRFKIILNRCFNDETISIYFINF